MHHLHCCALSIEASNRLGTSVGAVQGVPKRHVQADEHWLRHHLGQVGKTPEQLAEVLWENNWTAVAEVSHSSLCASSNANSRPCLPLPRTSAMTLSNNM